MTNVPVHATVYLTPAERYFRGEISLDDATTREVSQMREERAETRFGALNVIIRLVVLLIAIPVLLVGFLNPRRWC